MFGGLNRLVRLLMAVGLTVVLLFYLDIYKIAQNLRQVSIPICSGMILINFILILFFAGRWKLIGDQLRIDAPHYQYIKAIWASQFASQIGPTILMAEGTRFVFMQSYAGKLRTATSQALDRVSGQLVLFALVILCSPFYSRFLSIDFETSIWLFIVEVGMAGLLGGLLFIWLCKTTKMTPASLLQMLNPVKFTRLYVDSFFIQGLLIANLCLAALSLNQEFDVADFVLMAPLMFGTLTLLPVSVSDWGTREVSAILIFKYIGMDAEHIMSFSLIFGLINLTTALPGAFFFFDRDKRSRSVHL